MSITDKRVTSMKEIIDSMRLIKMYAWEESFLSRILEIRSKEIKELFKPSMLMSCTLTVSPSISILAGFGTTMVMTLAGVELSTTQAFTVMSVFSALQVCLQLAELLAPTGALEEGILRVRETVHPCVRLCVTFLKRRWKRRSRELKKESRCKQASK